MLNIGGVDIGFGHPCRFVAEISNNHNGDKGLAIQLIDAAKSAGADFVKFQAYTADELIALRGDGPAPAQWGEQGWTMRQLYTKAQTPLDWMPLLFQHARSVGLVPFASVFGLESLVALEKCACPAYKIASLDHAQAELIEAVASRRKTTIVSLPEPMHRLQLLAPYPGGTLFLYCPSGYPTQPENVALPTFGSPIYKSPGFIGLSSHCLDPLLPVAAVARGAKLLEYHFQSAETPSELEANISLNPYQFNQMVHEVRAVEAMIGQL